VSADHVLLDLDGTLVDSSQSILASLGQCLADAGLNSCVPLTPALIGPPLQRMVALALGSDDPARAAPIIRAFAAEYDSRGYRAAAPYPGIDPLLRAVAAAGRPLHIVTNKRRAPTEKILAMFGWEALFASVNTLDSTPGARTKADVVAGLVARHALAGPASVLIGDTEDDAIAAERNGLGFGWATWGYGRALPPGTTGTQLADADALARFLARPHDRCGA
jgi:phosphoglycolate phosphatase